MGSNVRLELAHGATLWGSRRAEDYLRGNAALLVAEKAQSIELVGPGTLRGIGEGDLGRRADKSDAKMPEFRAGILRFTNCRDITVRDLHVLYSDTWGLQFRFCKNVTIEGVTIRNHYFHTNADGIDPVSCKKVRIARCDIVAGDDCIVCKTADGHPCEDVRVSDCKLESIATAIKLGTVSSGDFRDMQFTNCTIRNSTVGIGLFLKDGGTMEQIKFSQIRIENYTPRGETNVEKSMFHADKIRNPLLVLQGANDPRVIKPESDDIVAAVKKNNVPVDYVVFDDEGHGFTKKKNQIAGYRRIREFLDQYLGGAKP